MPRRRYPTPPPTARGAGASETRPWTPRERHQIYLRGFRDGASCTAMRHPAHPDYDAGYADGQEARRRAATRFAKAVGYEPFAYFLCAEEGT